MGASQIPVWASGEKIMFGPSLSKQPSEGNRCWIILGNCISIQMSCWNHLPRHFYLHKSLWPYSPIVETKQRPPREEGHCHLEAQILVLKLGFFFCVSLPLWAQTGLHGKYLMTCCPHWGLPGGASGKEPDCQPGDIRDASSIPVWRRSPEEGMATHSSILAWRVPWTEKLGGLQSIGLQRVRHNWS